MILHPPIIALLLGSCLTCLMLLLAVRDGLQIARKWDLTSGSELQLELERKTYLVSTIISYAFGFQLLSFFLFIYTANDLSRLFVGAMCAVGTLNVNAYGYPTLLLKIVTFLLAGTWLILNFTDNQAYDYPLIKRKYLLLLLIAPIILAETILQTIYFLQLSPDVITSCCGSLFSSEASGVTASLAAFPANEMRIVFYSLLGVTLLTGIFFYRTTGRTGYLFSLLCLAAFLVAIAALISFISLYIYAMPTHHCPFCILQKEYGYIGYIMYTLLLTGAVSGMGIGLLMPVRKIASLKEIVPSILRKLTLFALVAYGLFALMTSYKMIFSDFRLT